MKVKYIGQSFGVDSLTNGKVYEVLEVDKLGFLRVIDDSEEDYLYDAINPAPLDGENDGGRWDIVEDDDQGTLKKAMTG